MTTFQVPSDLGVLMFKMSQTSPRYRGIPAGDRMLFLSIVGGMVGGAPRSWWSQMRLSEVVGCSARSVRDKTRRLVAAGLLIVSTVNGDHLLYELPSNVVADIHKIGIQGRCSPPLNSRNASGKDYPSVDSDMTPSPQEETALPPDEYSYAKAFAHQKAPVSHPLPSCKQAAYTKLECVDVPHGEAVSVEVATPASLSSPPPGAGPLAGCSAESFAAAFVPRDDVSVDDCMPFSSEPPVSGVFKRSAESFAAPPPDPVAEGPEALAADSGSPGFVPRQTFPPKEIRKIKLSSRSLSAARGPEGELDREVLAELSRRTGEPVAINAYTLALVLQRCREIGGSREHVLAVQREIIAGACATSEGAPSANYVWRDDHQFHARLGPARIAVERMRTEGEANKGGRVQKNESAREPAPGVVTPTRAPVPAASLLAAEFAAMAERAMGGRA